jgi:hypothetical protein
MLRCLITGVWVLIFQYGSAQTFNWGKTPGGIGNDASTGIVHDAEGNVYVCGNIAGSAEFNGVPYAHYELYESFLAKYNPEGVIEWVGLGGGHGVDKANAICRDADGNLWITGYFEDTAWFENYSVVARGDKDIFVAKYTSGGTVSGLWSFGGPETDIANAITTDAAGNVYVAGYYEDQLFIGNQSLSTANFFSESFIISLNSIGQVRWGKTFAGSSSSQATGLAVNLHQHIGISGFFGGNLSYQATTISSDGPSFDAYIAVIDTNGLLQWIRPAGGSYEDAANGITASPTGNWVMMGYFSGTASFSGLSLTYYDYNDIFVASYTSAGICEWVKKMGGYKLDYPGGICSDEAGNIYVTGFYEDQAEFSGGWVSGTDRDCFVVSLSTNGNYRWSTVGGGVQADVGLAVTAANDHIWVAGYYLHTCSFGSVALDYAQNNDAFVVQLTPPAVQIATVGYSNLQIVCNGNLIKLINKPQESTARLYDVSGKLVYNTKSDFIPVELLSPGIHFLSVEETFYKVCVTR